MSRAQWRELRLAHAGDRRSSASTMFQRLVPNLREIGLLGPRIMPHYERVGLMKYFGGAAADKVTGDQMIQELEREAA